MQNSPKWNPRPILHSWTPDQARIAACFPQCRRVAVPAANGVGKTFLAADLVASFIQDMPAAKIIITAPTNRQVSELLWPHVTERLLHLGLADVNWIIPTKPKWKGGDGDSLIGFATNTPQRLQGFHAPYLLIICDEASGMPISLIEALEGIAVDPENYILLLGNPNEPAGAFYNATRQPSYRTEPISALTHPNILAREQRIPGATSWIALVDRIRDWCKEVDARSDDTFELEISDRELGVGESEERRLRIFQPNDAFRVRYLGRFPSSASWQLIEPAKIALAMDAQKPSGRPHLAAIDVARTGGDRTILGIRRGESVTRMRVIPPSDLVTQAQEAAALLKVEDPECVTVDAGGLGIGFIDHLRGITDIPIREFNGAEEPLSPAAQKRYFNRRAAAYGALAEAFMYHAISIPKDTELADELAAVAFKYTPDQRTQILRKEEIKLTLGRSPDAADVVAMLWDPGAYVNVPQVIVNARPRQREEITW